MNDSEFPSKSQKKRDSLALQALGERLVELSPHQLDHIEIPAGLRDAVDAARAISARGGRKRQLQYIGKLMRSVDPEPIRAALAKLDESGLASRALLHRAEHWRTRLLEEGDDALGALIEQHPDADRQHLRRLVRDALAERDAGRPPRHQRALFRYLVGLPTVTE
ncbi:MAG: ribosome biogenesis factor YjgA [Gammaproteobacteria bacterium]